MATESPGMAGASGPRAKLRLSSLGWPRWASPAPWPAHYFQCQLATMSRAAVWDWAKAEVVTVMISICDLCTA